MQGSLARKSFIITYIFSSFAFDKVCSSENEDNPTSIKENTFSSEQNLTFPSSNNYHLNCLGIPIGSTLTNMVENMFTQSTKAEDVRFYFYTRDKSNETVHLQKTSYSKKDFNLKNINFEVKKNSVIIVHGFMSNGREKWVENMRKALLEMNDLNVIQVDWQKGSNVWNYYSASISTRIVGTQIAELFHKIKEKALEQEPRLESLGSLHFVGHSLGAHISAHASYEIKSNNRKRELNWKVRRITGLDPAQPCFSTADFSLKLDEGDADFVDVIHTNARHILLLGLGLPNQIGHMDFYPNGGQIQLGCNDIRASFWSFLTLPVNVIREAVCSHGRSHELFTDSINVYLSGECTYIGHKWDRKYENLTELIKDDCDNVCPELGINAINYHPNVDGTYFVSTGDSAPYCKVDPVDRIAMYKQLNEDKTSSNSIIAGYANEIFD